MLRWNGLRSLAQDGLGEWKLYLAQGGTERQGGTEGGLMGAIRLYNVVTFVAAVDLKVS